MILVAFYIDTIYGRCYMITGFTRQLFCSWSHYLIFNTLTKLKAQRIYCVSCHFNRSPALIKCDDKR